MKSKMRVNCAYKGSLMDAAMGVANVKNSIQW